jgi:hypothetical protein
LMLCIFPAGVDFFSGLISPGISVPIAVNSSGGPSGHNNTSSIDMSAAHYWSRLQ